MSTPELSEEEKQQLVDACIAAKAKAHAPYSNFRVGAALLTKTGKLYTGVYCAARLLM